MREKIELAMETVVAVGIVFGFTFGLPWAVYMLGLAQ